MKSSIESQKQKDTYEKRKNKLKENLKKRKKLQKKINDSSFR